MTRTRKPAEPEITQEAQTLPVQRDAQGFELDRHGLPVNLRLRAEALELAGIPDPELEEGAQAPATQSDQSDQSGNAAITDKED